MKTPDEIKRGLVTCTELVMPADVQHAAMVDALAYIQQLERENAQKDERIKQYKQDTNGLWFLSGLDKLPVRLNFSFSWISVEERLPEDQRSILTVNGHGLIRIMGLYHKRGDKWSWLHNERIMHYNDITHWMPLPEPPNEWNA